MSTIWFTSDTHFNHALVADIRGFDSARAHDEYIIDTWNAHVRPNDFVWHLGDVGMGSISRFSRQLSRLHGKIHLIAGNHDECAPIHRSAHKHQRDWMTLRFESVQAYTRVRIAGEQVLLSHYPYNGDHTSLDRFTQYRLRDEGLWLFHGHTHSSHRYGRPRQIHVGVDAWDLAPVNVETLANVIKRKSEAA